MKIENKNTLIRFEGLKRQQTAPKQPDFTSDTKFLTGSLDALANYNKALAFKGHTDSLKPLELSKPKEPVGPKLAALRKEMKKEGLDALLVMSQDEYLNETVDKNQSQRIYISNFSGSAGDVVVTPDKAHIVVDGRYHIQAEQEVDKKYYKVEKVGVDDKDKPIKEYPYQRLLKVLESTAKKGPVTVGYDPNTISVTELKMYEDNLKQKGAKVTLKPTSYNLVDKIRGGRPPSKAVSVRQVPVELTGESTEDKLSRLRERMKAADIDALVATNLIDIAYLTNLRGKDIDYSAVFKSKAIIGKDKAYVCCNPASIPQEIRDKFKGIIEFKPEDAFSECAKEIIKDGSKGMKIGYSPSDTNVAIKLTVEDLGAGKAKLVELSDNPVEEMRSIKNDKELAAYQDSLTRADKAVTDVIKWIEAALEAGKNISEKDLEEQTRDSHFAHGADSLSFEVIPASGPNAAIVHYSVADPNKKLTPGEIILLDTGGYYDAGLATDLTRSWLAGGNIARATDTQKEVYTLVLKGSLRGINAELPPGADGAYLDKLVRDPIREKGYDFNHGTGHGIGIAVHESPPSISSRGGVLKEGMVFSVEPGIYIKDWGGVRFENIVTVVKHSDPEKAAKGWHQIKCLTFAPLDHNLVDEKLLDEKELNWIREFDEKSRDIANHKD